MTVIMALAYFTASICVAWLIGKLAARIRLPQITGYLLTGIMAGPFVSGLVKPHHIKHLRFVDKVSLAIIAFVAGTELFLKELKSRWKSIAWITTLQSLAIFVLGGLGLMLLADVIPFMRNMAWQGRFAVGLLAGAILIARSPSSAVALVNELRAKGPFTQTVLGVTMVTDVVVIVLFAVSFSLSQGLLTSQPIDASVLEVLGVELGLSLCLGVLVGRFLQLVLWLHTHRAIKRALLLLVGYSVFVFGGWFHHISHDYLPWTLHMEPLLICMIASFVITNYSQQRDELVEHLHVLAPPIYVAFFTLTGISLGIDVLLQTWSIALLLVGLRLVTLMLGSWAGGKLAGDPQQHNRLSWLTYVTQAGVGLGLAKQVAAFYPTWGNAFATMMISVIVINQLVGPPFFKWAIQRVKEANVATNVEAVDQEEVELERCKPAVKPAPSKSTNPIPVLSQ